MDKLVSYRQDGTIGRITLTQPEKSNPITKEVLEKLIEAFNASAENGDLCVIYGAEGKNFTFGADLKYAYELMTQEERRYEATEYLWSWQRLTTAMLKHPGIVIVGYHGWIVGGGFEHTLGSDIRIAAENTRFMMPELDIGIFFSNASTRLIPQLVGLGRAKELMIMGNEFNAEEAYRIGLINRICPVDELDSVMDQYAEKIVSKEPNALRLAKKQLNESLSGTIDDVLYKEGVAMIETGQSEGAIQRIKAFLNVT